MLATGWECTIIIKVKEYWNCMGIKNGDFNQHCI